MTAPSDGDPPDPADRGLRDWARTLAENWEARAALPSRDLFVASHPGWNDPVAWERHARVEAELFVSGLDESFLAAADLLEIGCGSGRMVPILRPMCCSYTGFDIAKGMIEAAERRARDLDGVRFFHGDGLSVPAGARDRDYQLIVSIAVMIHCPKEVIRANVASAWSVLAPGGHLRFQVLGDPEDREGIVTTAAQVDRNVEALIGDQAGVVAQMNDEERRLAFDTYYMGAQFRYAELEPFVREIAADADVVLYRGDPGAIYVGMTKPE